MTTGTVVHVPIRMCFVTITCMVLFMTGYVKAPTKGVSIKSAPTISLKGWEMLWESQEDPPAAGAGGRLPQRHEHREPHQVSRA